MQAYRIETKLEQDKKLVLENLPFHAGESIEVIILSRSPSPLNKDHYPLRGMPVHYIDPTEPVAIEDWDACDYSRHTHLDLVGTWRLKVAKRISRLFPRACKSNC